MTKKSATSLSPWRARLLKSTLWMATVLVAVALPASMPWPHLSAM